MQTLKSEKREAIVAAARTEILRHGRASASIADIAKRARVSTGLVYRYFADKDALYAAAVPRTDVKMFRQLLVGRAKAYGSAAYAQSVRALGQLVASHREVVIIAVREELFDELVVSLVEIAMAHAGRRDAVDVLTLIYRAFLQNVLSLLETEGDVETYARYHLAGMRGLLAHAD